MKKKLLYSGMIFLLTILVAITGYMFIIFMGNYVIDEEKLVMNSASKLVDEKGNDITRLYLENRELVSIENIPTHVQEAFIAVEDQRFYDHHGIDAKAIARALYRDILAGGKVEGGSTITQQLAKNIFLSNDKTLLRKTKEAIIAINLEDRYTKSKLIEMYLNHVYFGHGAYGVQAASNFYFKKDVSELTIEEGALLAGLPKAPTTFSPLNHPEKSKQRRDLVIRLMGDQKFISYEEVVRTQGKTLSLNVKEQKENSWLATYVDMVFDEAKERYSLSNEELLRGGYTITVPLNREVQKTAFELFKENDYFPGTDEGAQGAFVLMNNKTGGVLAAIGGRDYVPKGLNRLNTIRQPGSTFKPLAVYGPSLEENKFQPYSLLVDEALSYGDYSPRNYDGKYTGQVSMFDALVASKNAPAVWTLNELGVNKSKEYLSQVGMEIDDEGLAIALGGLENGVSPLQIANAYRTFAQNGSYSEPYLIQKIVNRDNKVIAEVKKVNNQVYSPQTAWNMTRMLQHVVEDGTAQSGKVNGELAGKTGTTSFTGISGASKDAWFVGYTPEVVGTVWMGYDKTDKKHYLVHGSSYPTKLFKEILTKAQVSQNLAFQVPDGIDDLESPIRLEDIERIEAKLTFQPFGLITVMLKWEPQEDDRVVYRIYENERDTQKLVGAVTGEGSYEIPYANMFSDSVYQVVPYNVQTKEEGKGTGPVKPSLFSSNP